MKEEPPPLVLVGAGGHGLATAYYLGKNHGITDVAVIEKGWLGGGNTGRNTTIIRDNVIEEGPKSSNPHTIHFGGESTPHAGSSLVVSGNTIINHRAQATAQRQQDAIRQLHHQPQQCQAQPQGPEARMKEVSAKLRAVHGDSGQAAKPGILQKSARLAALRPSRYKSCPFNAVGEP